MERLSTQDTLRIFEHYMSMDPTHKVERCFIENKCRSLAQTMFLDAQCLELLRDKLSQGESTWKK